MWSVFPSTLGVVGAGLPRRPGLWREAREVRQELTWTGCSLAGGRAAGSASRSAALAHQPPHLRPCGRGCWAATSPPVVQEPTCNSHAFRLGGEVQETARLKVGRANPLGMAETTKQHRLVQLDIYANGADFEHRLCPVYHSSPGRFASGNSLQNMPPQTDQNKSYFQLHAPPQTTIHTKCISSYVVHESFLFCKAFPVFTRPAKKC